MLLRTRLVAPAAVAVLMLGAAGGALAAADGPYPVWWSPVLELESLDRIDERLARKLWLDGGEIEVSKGGYDTAKKMIVDTCVSAIELSKMGYQGLNNPDHKILLFQLAKCRAIEMLKRARPARISYVRNFVLDRDALDYLPAIIGLVASCGGICWQYAANERRIPWKRHVDIRSVDVRSGLEFELRTDVDSIAVKILARADFNDDGLEDLLVWSNAGATGGTWGATEIFALSREAPDNVMWVLNAERYLCAKYQCDADYDFSEVLR